MKRLILSLALSLAVLTVPARTVAATPVHLLAIDMVSPSSGWGITQHNVVWTTDGGQHWTAVFSSFGSKAVPLTPTLSARSAQVAWVVVPLSPVAGGSMPMSRVFSTTDGGRHWHRSADLRGYTSSFTSVDAHHAWLLTSEGAAMSHADFDLYRTTGGVTWHQVAYGHPFQAKHAGTLPTCNCLSGISFRDATNGWLTGSFGVRPNYWIFYRTHDSGRTWTNASLPAPRGYRRDNLYTASPAFFGNEGVLLTSYSFPFAFVLYRSHDGGKTWSPTTPIPATQATSGWANAFALDSWDVWALVGGKLYRTIDGGVHWAHLSHLSLQSETEMDFVTPSVGYILSDGVGTGRAPVFLRTANGGRTWVQINAVM